MSEAIPPPVTPPPAAPAAPAKSGNRTLIIVLCVVGGLLLLMGGCAVGCTYLVSKKAKEFAADSEKNPAYLGLTMLASFSPEVEIVSKDSATGVIKLRNKKSGEVVTIDTTQYTANNIGAVFEKIAAGKGVPVKLTDQAAKPDYVPPPYGLPNDTVEKFIAGKGQSVTPEQAAEFAGNLTKFPAFLSAYPDATTLSAEIKSAMGMNNYEYSAQTKAKPAAVAAFYEKKLTAAGFTVVNRGSEPNEYGPAVSLVVAGSKPAGTVTLEASTQENGQVLVNIVGVLMEKP